MTSNIRVYGVLGDVEKILGNLDDSELEDLWGSGILHWPEKKLMIAFIDENKDGYSRRGNPKDAVIVYICVKGY